MLASIGLPQLQVPRRMVERNSPDTVLLMTAALAATQVRTKGQPKSRFEHSCTGRPVYSGKKSLSARSRSLNHLSCRLWQPRSVRWWQYDCHSSYERRVSASEYSCRTKSLSPQP